VGFENQSTLENTNPIILGSAVSLNNNVNDASYPQTRLFWLN
jgi:hypothetical protein